MKKFRVNSRRENSRIFVYQDLEFAKLDFSRERRQNFPEAIYCPGKSIEQIIKIVANLKKENRLILLTRAEQKIYRVIKRKFSQAKYYKLAKIITVTNRVTCNVKRVTKNFIAIITAGTSDIPVAEEAAVTAEVLGNKVERIYDVGVAGIHRLLSYKDKIVTASVVIVCAGMEGALPSIVGGLVPCPVIGVPTSVGYGSSFQGMTALFTMLNSCSANVCCVNIDDGFGAGVIAHLINKKTIQTD